MLLGPLLKRLSILVVAVIMTPTLSGDIRMTVSSGYSWPSIISSNIYYDDAIIPLRVQITADGSKRRIWIPAVLTSEVDKYVLRS